MFLTAIIQITGPAQAVEPDEILSDSVLEARARELSRQLRCVVCQSQNIDDSNAPLAKDLRLLVRERLVAGDSDDQVISYLVERYGDYVLLKPPVQRNTLFLWAAPIFAVGAAGAVAAFYFRRTAKATAQTALSDDEKSRIDKMLG